MLRSPKMGLWVSKQLQFHVSSHPGWSSSVRPGANYKFRGSGPSGYWLLGCWLEGDITRKRGGKLWKVERERKERSGKRIKIWSVYMLSFCLPVWSPLATRAASPPPFAPAAPAAAVRQVMPHRQQEPVGLDTSLNMTAYKQCALRLTRLRRFWRKFRSGYFRLPSTCFRESTQLLLASYKWTFFRAWARRDYFEAVHDVVFLVFMQKRQQLRGEEGSKAVAIRSV